MGPEHDDEELQHVENLRERSMTIKLKVEILSGGDGPKTSLGRT